MNKKIEKYQDINGNVYQLTTELEKVILNDLIKETESVVELSDENIKLKNKIDKAIEYINTHSEMTDFQIYGIENTLYFRGSVDKLLDILKGGKDD